MKFYTTKKYKFQRENFYRISKHLNTHTYVHVQKINDVFRQKTNLENQISENYINVRIIQNLDDQMITKVNRDIGA